MTSDSTVWAPRKSLNSSTIDNSQYETDNQSILCVKDLGNGERFTELEHNAQNDVFQKLILANVEPEWISGSACCHVSENDPNFYVFPSFRGHAFHYLNNLKVKVIGASLVTQCLTEGRAIPKWSHPVFSMNLSGAVICFTGLQPDLRNHLTNLIKWMDGMVSKSFTSNVTHLVTSKCESNAPKYKVARQLRIPIMSPRWIEDGWERASNLVVEKLTSPELIKTNILPIFSNLVICTSGIAGQDRSDMGRLIELHGGKNPGDMKRSDCTHLIMEGVTGPKYRKAREWGKIHIVDPRWLRKCVEDGYLLNERQFDPSAPQLRSSTQAPNGIAPPVDLDFSSIHGSAKIHPPSQSFNATAERERVDRTNNTPATTTRPKFIRRESSRQMSYISTISRDPIDNLSEMSYRGDFDFLEGCLIWLCGVQDVRAEKWKRVLDRCGATRVVKPDNATHIVVLNGAEDKKILLDARQRGVVIVRPEWVIECVQKKDLLPVDDFIWTENIFSRITNPSFLAASMLSDKIPVDIEVAREEPLVTAGTATSVNLSLKSQSSSTRSQSDTISVCNKIYEGLKFRFRGLSAESVRNWSVQVRRASGVVLSDSDDSIADYMIHAQVEYGALVSPIVGKYRYLVTECWIKSCITKSQLVDRKSHPLFRPIPAVQGTTLFDGVVIGFLGLENYEKSTYIELIQMFGGRVESSIVAKVKNGVFPCTHLIPGATNAKIIECSRKIQKLKIVDPSWIIESIINDKLLLAEHFPLEDVAYTSYEGRTDDLWVERLPVSDDLDDQPSSTMTVDEVDNFLLGEAAPSVQNSSAVSVSRLSEETLRETRKHLNKQGLRLDLKGVTQMLEEIVTPEITDNESTLNSFSISRLGKVLAEAAAKASAPAHKSRSDILMGSDVDISCRDYSASEVSRGYATRSRKSVDSPKISIEDAIPFFQHNEITAKSRKLVEQQLAEMRQEQQREEQAEAEAEAEAKRLNLRRRKRCFDITDSPQPKRFVKKNEDDYIDWQPRPAPLLKTNHSPDNQNIFRTQTRSSSSRSINREIDPRVGDDAVATTMSSVRTSSSTNISFKNEPSRQLSETRILTSRNSELNQSERNVETKLSSRNRPQFTQPKVFLFTSINAVEEKNNLTTLIVRLGGEANSQEKNELTDNSTHLICGRLVRGTKLMGFIASGKWVLTIDYIESSAAAGRWLNEEDFEWSHPNMLAKYKLQGRDLQIALACKRWRKRIENMRNSDNSSEPVGAFSGKRFLLYSRKDKAVGLTPLIEAGKAVVATRDQIVSLQAFRPTHVICCNSNDWNERDLRELFEMNAKIFTLDYISKYLLEETVDEESCYHPDYKILLLRR